MTRGRWMALGAGVLVILLVAWVARNTYFEVRTVPRPPRGEARTTPFYAVQKLAQELGAAASSGSALGDVPQDGVVVMGFLHWGLLPSRQQALQEWVENGGRLVVDQRLVWVDAFATWSGIRRVEPERDDDELLEKQGEPEDSERCHPLTARDGRTFDVCQYGFYGWLSSAPASSWSLSDGTHVQALRVARGRGSITAINAAPFVTTSLFEGDHARLFVTLTQLRRGDTVRFIAENERPSLLALVWQHGWPVVVMAGLWLGASLWRRSGRFGPVAPDPEPVRRSLAEQIRGTGQFALRVGGGDVLYDATLRALVEAARTRITGFARLGPQEQASAIARAAGVDAAALEAAMTFADHRRTSDLRQAIARLEDARRQLSTRSTAPTHGTH